MPKLLCVHSCPGFGLRVLMILLKRASGTTQRSQRQPLRAYRRLAANRLQALQSDDGKGTGPHQHHAASAGSYVPHL